MSKKSKSSKMIKRSQEYKEETNNTALKRLYGRGGQQKCVVCGPWKGENTLYRKAKHGAKKPKYKNKRANESN